MNRFLIEDEAVATATEAVISGDLAMKTALYELQMGYSKFWLHVAAVQVEALGLQIEPTGAAIAAARAKGDEHASWGWLAVRANMPEGKARKLFEEHENVYSMGLRIGKGGRFVQGDSRFYRGGNAKAQGTATELGEVRVPVTAEEQLAGHNMATLRAMVAKAGVKPEGKKKADLIAALLA